MSSVRPLAIVTGASSGIGYHLARLAALHGHDLLIAADEAIEDAAESLGKLGAQVTALRVDLGTADGIEQLWQAAAGHPVELLLANAGHGLGHGFLDQDFDAVRHLVDTNVTGTLSLVHRVGRQMRSRGRGRILLTGSIAGFMPGTFQAAYNASKAFIDSFAAALRNELQDSGVTVTCLMPGVTDTRFFERAGLLDTAVGRDMRKADPADVARTGWDALMRGDDHVVHGLKNRLQVAAAGVLPDTVLAEQHRNIAAPGSARQ